MAVQLFEKLDFKIQTKEKLSVYPITVQLELSKEDKATFEVFKDQQEEKHKEIQDASKKVNELGKKILRLSEDIEDINDELKDEELDHDELKELRVSRKETRIKLRELEDERDDIRKVHNTEAYQVTIAELTEAVAKKSFDMSVEEDEKREALENAIENLGLNYSVVVSELGRLIGDAKKKKKRRS